MVDPAPPPSRDPAPQPAPTPSSTPGPDIDPGRDSAERVQSRASSSDFAALPREELEAASARRGPAGAGIDAVSLPLVTIAMGCIALLLGLFFSSFVVLGVALLVLLVGVVWRAVAGRRRR